MLGDSREGDGVPRPRLELLGSGGGSQWARANSERSEKHRGHGAGNALSQSELRIKGVRQAKID